MASNYANAMASLNRYCQKNDFTLVYNTVSVEGPSHDRVFTVTVSVNNKMYTPATGKSKKEAKGLAAELAWKTIEQEEQADTASRQRSLPSPSPPQTPQASRCAADLSRASTLSSEASTSSLGASPLPSVPYISLLNEYKQKNKVDIDYIWGETSGRDHMPIFSVACKIGSNVFPEGTGSNKQAAKFNAARLACEQLNIQPTSRTEQSATPSSNVGDTLSSSSEEVSEASENATDSGFGYKNAVDSLGDGLLAVKLNETSLASPKGPVIKHKRKETPLAPKFSNLCQRESEYTENERFLKEYKDIKSIGTGGFGDVFKATHAIDNSEHAIKRVVFSCEETAEGEKAKREVQVLAKLEHENIVRYYTCWIGEDKSENSLGKTCTCLFIDMEFCENTLEAWISENVQRHEDALKKFQQIVEGVEYIHFQNIIHRDLKPANIFISRDNKIKIGDFGLATSDIDGRSVERTKNTGTKSYMAPEQVHSKYGKEVDLFSLGLIFFEMICGFEKWFALTAHERSEKWQSIRDCKFPQEFVQKFPKEKSIISKLLSKPSQRPSASELLRFLKNNVDRGYSCFYSDRCICDHLC